MRASLTSVEGRHPGIGKGPRAERNETGRPSGYRMAGSDRTPFGRLVEAGVDRFGG